MIDLAATFHKYEDESHGFPHHGEVARRREVQPALGPGLPPMKHTLLPHPDGGCLCTACHRLVGWAQDMLSGCPGGTTMEDLLTALKAWRNASRRSTGGNEMTRAKMWLGHTAIVIGHLISSLGCRIEGGHTPSREYPQYCLLCGRRR